MHLNFVFLKYLSVDHDLNDFHFLLASAMTCFEKRLGCLTSNPSIDVDKMVEANAESFSLSVDFQFSLPWYQIFPTPKWRKFVRAEDYSYEYVNNHSSECKLY